MTPPPSTDPPTRKLSWKGKLALVFFGLLLSAVLLEVGLRVAGVVVQNLQTQEYLPTETAYLSELRYQRDRTYERYQSGTAAPDRPAPAATTKIVTIGDSFVNAGNARSFESYPYHLFKMLEGTDTPATVLNMGKCQDSTFGVAARLGTYLRGIEDPDELPDVVVVFAGSADKFNLNAGDQDFETVTVDWHDDPTGFFEELRITKLFRHIKLGLFSRRLRQDLRERVPADEEAFASFQRHYADFKQNAAEHGWRDWRDTDRMNDAFRTRNREIARSLAAQVSKYFSTPVVEHIQGETPEQLLDSLAVGQVMLYASKLRHDDALEGLLEVAGTFPVQFWKAEPMSFLRYQLFQMFQLQNRFTAEAVLARLTPTLARHPELEGADELSRFLELLRSSERMDEVIDQRRRAAWEEIVTLARDKGVKLVLQNYPSDYRSANAILAEVAKKYGLPLVDNEALFADLIADAPRDRYLEDDDHCSPEGYRLMAEALLDVMRREGVLPD